MDNQSITNKNQSYEENISETAIDNELDVKEEIISEFQELVISQNEELKDRSEPSISKSKIDEEFDTDMEIKENNVSYDHTGKTAYIRRCYKEGVIPTGYFLRHINEKKLDMKHHGLGLSGIKPICASLITNGTITFLDLTDNWLGDQSITYLMVMMKENCFISELILANNNLTYKCAEMLALGLSENLQLSHLDLSQNVFDDRAAGFFGDLIANVNKLEYLNVSKNKFSSRCLLPFGMALTQTRQLVELDLSWNHITGNEMKHFCAGLTDNNTLKVLNLSWNGLGSIPGMQDFGKMLKTNTTLEEVDISNNRITTEGAVLLARGLSVNCTLKTLKIGSNPMQTAGCYAILSTILKNSNTAISLLDFENIRVNQDFVDLKSGLPATMLVLTGSRKPTRPSSSIHPIVRLKTFVRKHKLPLLKYFNHFDDAENMNLTKHDFRLCLQDTNFDLTENELERLIEHLDKKQNGFIYYKDFMELNFEENDSKLEIISIKD